MMKMQMTSAVDCQNMNMGGYFKCIVVQKDITNQTKLTECGQGILVRLLNNVHIAVKKRLCGLYMNYIVTTAINT